MTNYICEGEYLREKAGEMMPMHPANKHYGVCLDGVPMSLLTEERCMVNHRQSLARIKERGGLSINEFMAIIKNTSIYQLWKETDVKAQELKTIVDEHIASLGSIQIADRTNAYWQEGKEYILDKDFTIEMDAHPDWSPTYNNPDDPPIIKFAVEKQWQRNYSEQPPSPLAGKEQEDEMWKELIREVICNQEMILKEIIKQLKSKYSLRKL